MAHLGMSGQLLMQDSDVPDEKHLKVRLRLEPGGPGCPEQLRFVDQRIFGGLFVTSLIPTDDGGPGGLAEAPLPLDRRGSRPTLRATRWTRTFPSTTFTAGCGAAGPVSSGRSWTRAWCPGSATSTQTRPCGAPSCTTRAPRTRSAGRTPSGSSTAAREVMLDALAAGGTSFDSLYVNVNGASGYFDRSLNAYGREGAGMPAGAPPSGIVSLHEARAVHEPFLLHLPRLPAEAPKRPLVTAVSGHKRP